MKFVSNKVALAVGAGVVATGAIAVSAASLGTLSAAGVGTSTAAVSGCQTGSLTVIWDSPTYDVTKVYNTAGLTLGGIEPACQDKPYKLTVAQVNGISLVQVAGTTTVASAITAASFAAVDTELIGSVTLTIFNT